MAVGVPGNCADPLAMLHPKPTKRLREFLGANFCCTPIIAMDRAFQRARDDLCIAVPFGSVADQG